MTKKFCDICGKEIGSGSTPQIMIDEHGATAASPAHHYEVCQPCAKKVLQYIRSEQESYS